MTRFLAGVIAAVLVSWFLAVTVNAQSPDSWTYRTPTDEMTGKAVQTASILSANTVNFGFPYQGEQRATLMLREHPRFGFDIMVSIERGQFVCYRSCSILVRFDQQNPMEWPASPASSGNSNILFLTGKLKTPPQQIINLGGPAFLDELRKASELWVAAQFYGEGERRLMFRVARLEWPEDKPTPTPPPSPAPAPVPKDTH